MKRRFAKLGVYHHDCWYTKAINRFPEIGIDEVGHRSISAGKDKQVVTGTFRFRGQNISSTLQFLKNKVSSVRKLTKGNSPLVTVTWKTKGTAFDHILGSGCDYISPVYSQKGYETFDIIAKNFKEMKNVIKTAEDVGQLKVFRLGDSFDEQNMGLTPNQLTAVMSALNHGYYDWPKKVNLTKLAEIVGKKRRTLQENLRRAEAKLFPQAMKVLCK